MRWKLKSGLVPSFEVLQAINTEFAHASPQQIISWAVASYPKRLCLATMLDAEGCALVAMIAETAVNIPVYMLDTGRLSPDVHALRALLQQRYGLTIRMVYPSFAHATFEAEYGPLVESNPALCCRLNRWEPVRDLLRSYSARLAARRQALCPAMHDVEIASWEEGFHLMQVNPLAHWTDAQLVRYLDEQCIPHQGLDRVHTAKQCCMACPRPWDDVVPTHEQLCAPSGKATQRFWSCWR